MATILKNIQRIRILLAGLLFLVVYFLVNAQQYVYGFLIYAVIGALSIFFYGQWAKISAVGDLEGLGDHWIRNSFIGLGLGILTILVGQVFTFVGTIGFPQVSASIVGTIGRWFIIVPSASIFESVFFLDFLMDFFQSKWNLNKWFSLILMAIGASLFHLNAYGGSLSAAGGSFFSAFLMFFLFGVWAEYQNDLAAPIIWHATLNHYLAFVKLAIVG